MTPDEVRNARETLNRTPLGLAVYLDVSPEAVEAWEQGTAPVPPLYADLLKYEAAIAEREAALAASGLPECPWAVEWAAQPEPSDDDAIIRRGAEFRRHAKGCELCSARERWVEERFGPLPIPGTIMQRILAPVFRLGVGLPPRLRAVLLGALFGMMLTAIRVVLVLLTQRPSAALYLSAAKAMAIAAWAGAGGGLVYSFVRAPLRRRGRVGDYLTGILVVAGALLSVAVPAAIVSEAYRDGVAWVVGAVMAVFFGLIVGHSVFRTFEGDLPAADA